MTLITGNTFPHREAIKAAGGRWDSGRKGWWVPDGAAESLRALCAPRASRDAAPRAKPALPPCPVCGTNPCAGICPENDPFRGDHAAEHDDHEAGARYDDARERYAGFAADAMGDAWEPDHASAFDWSDLAGR